MAIDLSGYADALAMLYSDSCDVFRYTPVVDKHGGTRVSRSQVPVYQEVACLISPVQADDANPRELSHIPSEQLLSIHVKPDIELRAGDYLVLRKMRRRVVQRQYRGTIGEPKVYPTHIKAILKLDKAEV